MDIETSSYCDALLEQTAKGDQTAFSELFDNLAPQALGLANHIIREHAQAEEIVQEVFVEVWRHAPNYDASQGHARSWILRLTRMRAIDRLRSTTAAHNREEKDALLSAATWHHSVEDQAVSAIESAQIRTALNNIGEPHRTALALTYFSGLSNSELAKKMGVPLGTAKTRVRDGLRKLKAVLDNEGVKK